MAIWLWCAFSVPFSQSSEPFRARSEVSSGVHHGVAREDAFGATTEQDLGNAARKTSLFHTPCCASAQVVDGGGTYRHVADTIFVTGIVQTALSTPQAFVIMTDVTESRFRFRDNEGDRWTYERR